LGEKRRRKLGGVGVNAKSRACLVLGGLLVLICSGSLWTLIKASPAWFVAGHAIHAAVYAVAVWLVLGYRGQSSIAARPAVTAPSELGDRWLSPIAIILGIAVLVRLIAVAAPPTLTTDAYRYVWDGRVQAAGINPYLHVPAAPELQHLRDAEMFPNINRADTHPTIYPPVAEMLFLAGTRIIDGIRGLQILMLFAELVTIWALMRWLVATGLPRERVLIYAWHPLPVWEFAGMAHIDGAGVMLVSLALLAGATGRQAWAGAAFAAAGLVKYYLILLVPAVWRRWGWRMPAAFVATILVCYLPYISAGPKLLGSLFVHLGEEGYSNGYGFYLTGIPKHFGLPYPPSTLFAACVGLGLLTMGAAFALRAQPERIQPEHLIALTAAFLVAISPHYPWYYAMAIPLLCARMSAPLLWITLVVTGIYLDAPDGPLEPYSRFKVFSAMFGGAAALWLGLRWWGRAARDGSAAPGR
jgi:alpha-1,6-mannosyltransferase